MAGHDLSDPGTRAVTFINKLTHTGRYSGKPFDLRPWQEKIVRDIFGTVNADGTRQYERMFLGIPRKHGKTELVAAMLVYMLFGEGIKKRNLEIYSASGDRQMAALIHKAALQMIKANQKLYCRIKHSESNQYKIISVPSLNNHYKALSSDGYKSHGLNPSAVFFDELHVFKDTRLIDALTTGSNTRDERLFAFITTAGDNPQSYCKQEWDRAKAVQDGQLSDPELYPVIYAADPSDDWTDEKTWFKSMPALGDFVKLDKIRKDCKLAKQSPNREAAFKQLYLNQWVTDLERVWLSVERWNRCAHSIDWSSYKGRLCYGGLDASTVRDLTSLVLIFPEEDGTYSILPYFWVPGETARERERVDRVPWMGWQRDGHCFISNGASIDKEHIKRTILDLNDQFNIKGIGYDPKGIMIEAEELYNAGVPMEMFQQLEINVSPAAKFLEKLILDEQIRHDGNPVLTWNVGNAGVEVNKYGGIRPKKLRENGRIDGLMAATFAFGLIKNDQIEVKKPTKVIEFGPMFING